MRCGKILLALLALAPVASAAPAQVMPPVVIVPNPEEPLEDLVPVDAEMMAFDASRVLRRPGASLRSYFAHLVAPASTITIRVRCEVDRAQGWVKMCDVPQPQRLAEIAAGWLGERYRFALDPRIRAGTGPLAVVIEERISPADARPPLQGTPIPVRDISFSRLPTADELETQGPIFRGESPVRVSVDCVVQQDLTLFCADAFSRPSTGGFDRSMAVSALQISSFFVVTPTLANGQPARGARFSMVMLFEPPEVVPDDPPDPPRIPNGPTPSG